MKIRNKIALIFTLITALLQLLAFAFIYYFANQYKENEFYHRLRERAVIAAEAFLKEDELSAAIYDEIRKEHLHILPEEHEYILPAKEANRLEDDAIPEHFPHSFTEQILEDQYAEGHRDDIYFVGIAYIDNEGDFVVAISARDIYGQAKLNNLLQLLTSVFLVSLGLLYILGLYYAREVLRPINEINLRANSIRASNLHLRLPLGSSRDELTELAVTFNNMLDRLETSFEIQSNFINNASHELKNPLTAILGETELALNKARSAEEYKQTLKIVETEAHRLDLLVNSLLRLAQADYDNKGLVIQPIRVDELVLGVKNDLDNLRPSNYLTFDFTHLPSDPESITIQGNQSLLKVALTNIIDNACKFSENKEVTIRIQVKSSSVEISISDKGIGVPADELKNILETFYRASNVRGIAGFGVGLPLARKIIKMHGGLLQVNSTFNAGTTVTITLPNQHQLVSISR